MGTYRRPSYRLDDASNANRREFIEHWESFIRKRYEEYREVHYLEIDEFGARAWTKKEDDMIPDDLKELPMLRNHFRFTLFAQSKFVEELKEAERLTKFEDQRIKIPLRSKKPTGGKGIMRQQPRASIYSAPNLLLQVLLDMKNSIHFRNVIQPKIRENSVENRERSDDEPSMVTILQFRDMRVDFFVYQCIIRYLMLKMSEIRNFILFPSGEIGRFYSQQYFLDLFDGDIGLVLMSANGPLKDDVEFIQQIVEQHINMSYPGSNVRVRFAEELEQDIYDLDTALITADFIDADVALAGLTQIKSNLITVMSQNNDRVLVDQPRPPPPTREQSIGQPQRRGGKRTRDEDGEDDDDDEESIRRRSRGAIRSTQLLEF